MQIGRTVEGWEDLAVAATIIMSLNHGSDPRGQIFDVVKAMLTTCRCSVIGLRVCPNVDLWVTVGYSDVTLTF